MADNSLELHNSVISSEYSTNSLSPSILYCTKPHNPCTESLFEIVNNDGESTAEEGTSISLPDDLGTGDTRVLEFLESEAHEIASEVQLENGECKNNVGSSSRRSEREKKEKRSYSPTLRMVEPAAKKRKRRKIKATTANSKAAYIRPYDKLPDGSPFSCDLCKSPYVCNPGRRGNKNKVSKHMPHPRHKLDTNTGKILRLCNACGLAFDRPRKVSKAKPPPTLAERDKYLDEAKTFALSLVEGLNDGDAERLACPQYKSKPCACMQRYIIGDGKMEDSRKRASELLKILHEAKKLVAQKSYSNDDGVNSKTKRRVSIGLGNGQKRSKTYEDFMLKHRRYLRDELKFCERASQRVLFYSNNFLHKRLKTEERSRRVLTKGKAAMGLLKSIEELPQEKCCIDNCVMVALTHANLLQQWRDRAKQSQQEARRVLAEMLTPSGGARSNCYRFIASVTGCSHSTISRVNDQMRRTGGDRSPPEHGLKKYWQAQKKQQTASSQATVSNAVSTLSTQGESSTSVPLIMQRQQLLMIQRQITQQQLQLQQQQQLLQQTLGQVQHDIVQTTDTRAPHNSATTQNIISQLPDYNSSQVAPNVSLVQEDSNVYTDHQVWNTQTISIGNINYTVVIQPTGELLSVNPICEQQPLNEEPANQEQALTQDMVLLLSNLTDKAQEQ